MALMMVILSISAMKTQSTTEEMTEKFFSVYEESAKVFRLWEIFE